MNRLTRKVKYEGETLYGSPIGTKCDDFDQLQNIYNKLGKLEDIEDELGCPLDVVFKALKEGFVVKDDEEFILGDKNEYTHFKVLSFVYHEIYNEFGFGYGNDDESNQPLWFEPTKYYKKTWWLKEDLSE